MGRSDIVNSLDVGRIDKILEKILSLFNNSLKINK
jgi:hypothetical protein